MKIEKIQTQIKNKEAELESLKKQLQEEKSKQEIRATEWINIPGTDYQVTKEVLYKGKTYDEIMKLKKPEEELLTLKLIGIICENPELLKTLKMDSSSTNDDFFFKQPFPQNEKKNYVAGFYAGSDCAYLGCRFNSDNSDSTLGVRFAKKILKVKRNANKKA